MIVAPLTVVVPITFTPVILVALTAVPVITVPVMFVFPVRTIAPVPPGSIAMSPFVSDVIVQSASMFKSPIANVPVVSDPEIVVLPVVATSAVFVVP